MVLSKNAVAIGIRCESIGGVEEGKERISLGREHATYPAADKDLQIERNSYNRRSANIYSRGQPDLSR